MKVFDFELLPRGEGENCRWVLEDRDGDPVAWQADHCTQRIDILWESGGHAPHELAVAMGALATCIRRAPRPTPDSCPHTLTRPLLPFLTSRMFRDWADGEVTA